MLAEEIPTLFPYHYYPGHVVLLDIEVMLRKRRAGRGQDGGSKRPRQLLIEKKRDVGPIQTTKSWTLAVLISDVLTWEESVSELLPGSRENAWGDWEGVLSAGEGQD